MSGERVERRLAAILAADVAGYSRLMGEDEAGLARLKRLRRELIDPSVAEHKGRVVKTTGDGIPIEFPSVVEAVACAVAVQQGMAARNADIPQEQRIEFRVGINSGDVIVEDGDIHGDGVNIAARLEALAEPGMICVSAIVQGQVEGRLDCTIDDLGEQALKNIARPVRVYKVGPPVSGRQAGETPAVSAAEPAALPLPDKPSIAVLSFQNMTGDAEQEYFVDGIVEEIITAISRFRWLFVIARQSTFVYKGRAADVKQVARELGVRYVLEGSVRKAGNRIRITGQLIDTTSSAHIWADRFDGTLDDIFDLQDQVASGVVGAIEPKMLRAEFERVKRKPTANLDAYDCFLRGSAYVYQWTNEAQEEALRLFYRAIELDPDFAQAYAFATWCYCWRRFRGLTTDPAAEIAETRRLGQQAVRLAPDDAFALCWAGYSLAQVVGEFEEGAGLIDRALVLNPNLARAWNLSGWVRIWLGEPETAIEHLARAMRLSPLDPAFHAMETGTAYAHLRAGRYDEALSWGEKALRDQSNSSDSAQVVAVSAVLAGQLEKAQKAMARLVEIDPTLRLSNLVQRLPAGMRSDRVATLLEALRKAGLPE